MSNFRSKTLIGEDDLEEEEIDNLQKEMVNHEQIKDSSEKQVNHLQILLQEKKKVLWY